MSKETINIGSLGDDPFVFTPQDTTVSDLANGAGLVADAAKLVLSVPEEGLKIGVSSPKGLRAHIEETEDEWIVRVKKKRARKEGGTEYQTLQWPFDTEK